MMKTLTQPHELAELVSTEPAALVLFGGQSCGVCQAIKPQLEAMLNEHFPHMVACYVDCQKEASSLCAQQRVFSLPVVKLWFDGQPFDEFVRVFSLGEVRAAIQRPYSAVAAMFSAEDKRAIPPWTLPSPFIAYDAL